MDSTKSILWIVVAVGGIAAVAALFGPAEGWGGVDIGATGASLFVGVLGVLIWLFATRGAALFPDDMSIAERRAWSGLFFVGVVLLSFSRHLWTLWSHEIVPTEPAEFLSYKFVRQLLVLIIVWSVISHLIGRAAGGIETDERDLRLRHRADRVGDWTFTLIVIACISVLASAPASSLDWWLAPIVLANVLIGLLVVKSFVEHVALAYTYRVGGG
jgi:multisubunit Na+/H+ antiporter MnhG subunit